MAEKKITLGQAIDKIIEALDSVEPDARRTALEAACSHLGVKLDMSHSHVPATPASPPSTLVPPHQATPPPHSPPSPPSPTDIRTLKDQKQPSSAKQMACVVAYYLQELAPSKERKDTVSTQDLGKYFKQAGFKLPRALEQVLRDGKSSGYFESTTRGEYKLNAVGYNLVAHNLPKKKGD